MNSIRKYFFIMSLLFFQACDSQPPTCFDRVQAFVSSFAKHERKNGLRIVGKGGGIDHETGTVKLISMSFYTQKNLDLQNARKLSISTIDCFLEKLNSDIDLSNCLSTHPFPKSSIDLAIIDSGLTEDNYSCIKIISIYDGQIKYARNNPNDPYQSDWFHTETYEEAKQILANQTQE